MPNKKAKGSKILEHMDMMMRLYLTEYAIYHTVLCMKIRNISQSTKRSDSPYFHWSVAIYLQSWPCLDK